MTMDDNMKLQVDMWDSQIRIGAIIGLGVSLTLLGLGGAISIWQTVATLGQEALQEVRWEGLLAISQYLLVIGVLGLILFGLGAVLFFRKRREYYRLVKGGRITKS